MKKVFCLLLAAVLCSGALPVFAAADPWKDITLFIPDHVEDLQLTEMPEIPELDVPVLHCWMDTLGNGTTCPVVADPDGDFHVQFDTPVDSCSVDGNPVIIDENGYGSIAAELTNMQSINVSATVGNTVFDFYTSGALVGAETKENNYSFYYDENGECYWIELDEKNDYFLSGIDVQHSTITWERILLKKPVPGKTEPELISVWYTSGVKINFKEGAPLDNVRASYFNNEKHSLCDYNITYNVTPVTAGKKAVKQDGPDHYSISYSGYSYDCGEGIKKVHYEENQILGGTFQDLGPAVVTVVVSTSSSGVYDGALYNNASGKYFGSDKWVKKTDKTFYKGKKQLRRLDSFPSLRVKEK